MKDSLLTGLLVIAGWAVVHFLSEARERRKETRAQLDKLIERLFLLEKTAHDFFCSEKFDHSKAVFIQSEIERIEARALRMFTGKYTDALIPQIKFHRRSLTLNYFEDSSFKQQPSNSIFLQEITETTRDYEEALEYIYSLKYPYPPKLLSFFK